MTDPPDTPVTPPTPSSVPASPASPAPPAPRRRDARTECGSETPRDHRPLTLWIVGDGKPGHRSQIEGLRLALERRTEIRSIRIDPMAPTAALRCLLTGRFPAPNGPDGADGPRHCDLDDPDLIVVAGHRTHLTGLAARRATGARLVTLMRPSLPGALFDLCVVPQHDRAPRTGRIVRTIGALNPMRPEVKRPGSAAVMIGGNSRHFAFAIDGVLTALETLEATWPDAIVTDSRRTPASLRAELARRCGERYRPWERCEPGWMASTLGPTETAWITADSVSMVYEALTAGCATGLIELRPSGDGARPGKVARGLETLRADGRLVAFADFRDRGTRPIVSDRPLAEADAIAATILDLLASPRRLP